MSTWLFVEGGSSGTEAGVPVGKGAGALGGRPSSRKHVPGKRPSPKYPRGPGGQPPQAGGKGFDKALAGPLSHARRRCPHVVVPRVPLPSAGGDLGDRRVSAVRHRRHIVHPVLVAAPSVWDDTFRTLRDARPVSWHKAPEGSLLPTPPDDGFWAVVRHADIVAVSSQPDLYISSKGVQFEELPDDILQATQSIVALDAPRHLKLRSLVSSAFSPARMEQMRASMAEEVRRIVEDFATAGECDFVAKVSMPMARWTMTYMLGLEAAEIDRFTEAISIMLSSRDEAEKLGKDRAELVNEVVGLVSGTAVEMAKARRADPQDDVMTDLVQARVDGEGLTDAEISAFFLLLIGAGFDTPRQTISHAGKALSDFPRPTRPAGSRLRHPLRQGR